MSVFEVVMPKLLGASLGCDGQKTVPAVPQHGGTKGHSHRPSREIGHGESQKTRQTCTKEHRDVQGKELCFDTTNGGRSKRTHNDTGSSAPKRLKSGDSRVPGRTKEGLRDYLQRKGKDAEVTSPVKPRTPFSVELDKFESPKRFHMRRFQIYDSKSDLNFTSACT